MERSSAEDGRPYSFNTDLPTAMSSFSLAVGRIRLQRSMVKIVLALLNIEVRELMLADNMTAIKSPRTPAGE